MCIFCEIIKGNIPSTCIYEDEDMKVIQDIEPQAKIHYLALPKQHFASVCDINDEQAAMLGRCLRTIGQMANDWGLQSGFRLVSNKGTYGCQSVDHLHIHILGGEQLADKMA